MVNAQEYLDQKYPTKEERKNIEKLEVSNRSLEGSLDLRNFSNLKELDCSNNQLSSLNLSKCNLLSSLKCSNNRFINLDFDECLELTELECCKNQIKNKFLNFKKFP